MSAKWSKEQLEDAASKGDVLAMRRLGFLYEYGEGVTLDYVKAREWYEKGAAIGDASAINNLGSLYEYGQGVTQDYAKARELYMEAAAKGSPVAMDNLKALASGVEDPGPDRKEEGAVAGTEVEKLEHAAANGDATSMWRLGFLYQNGIGVPQNYAEARVWYEQAAAAGDADAMTKLGDFYKDGKGVPKDFVKASELYKRADFTRSKDALNTKHTTKGALPEELALAEKQIPDNIKTLQDWLDQCRADLAISGSLPCPTCGETLSRETLELGVCQNCKGRLVHQTSSGSAKRWVLSGAIATVAVAAAIAILSGEFYVLGSFIGLIIGRAGGGSPSGSNPPILTILIFLAIFGGLAALIIYSADAIIKYFAPPRKASAQLALATLAKQLSKRGDLQRAARFYAELVAYGFSDTFYVNTGRAYDCWKTLGPKAQELAFSDPYRDLLFYERLARYAALRQRGRDFESSALEILKELVSLASDSARLAALGDIYYGDGRVTHVAEALRGNLLTTNTVSGEEQKVSEVAETLSGKKYPNIADAFDSVKTRSFAFFRSMRSPVKPNRQRKVSTVRQDECACCQCGTVGSWGGLDAYAVFPVGIWTPPAGIGSAGTTVIWSRYLGCFELRLCNACLLVLTAATEERTLEFNLYRAAICRWIKERRGYLIAACSLDVVFQPRVSSRAVVSCKPHHVRFVIEPPVEQNPGRNLDLNKAQWNIWASSEFEIYSSGANELMPVTLR